MSKLECFIMASVYAALGVPLLIISLNTPEAEDLTKLKLTDLKYDTSKILDYPTNAVIVSKVLFWQKVLCLFKNTSKCQTINKQKLDLKHPLGTHDLSQEFNALRMISFVVSILLLVMSFVKLIEMFVVKSSSKKSSSKKKSRK